MKLSTVLMGVGIGAFALVGCGGDTDSTINNVEKTAAEKLLGQWQKACYHPSNSDHYKTKKLDFNVTHVKSVQIYFANDDRDCTGDVIETKTYVNQYTLGKKTKTTDGKDAIEYDKTWEGGGFYSVIQFDGDNKMNIAWDESGCETKETRCKTIGKNWKWFIKQ